MCASLSHCYERYHKVWSINAHAHAYLGSPECVGVRWEIWHLNHIKVTSEVHVVWPRPFNCPCLRGVAARDGSVHLMFSMDRKPSRKGGARRALPCASRTTILNQMLTGHRISTGSPQSIPIKTHSFPKAKMHTNPSMPFYHTAHARAHLISFVGGVTQHTCFKPSSTSIRPYGPLNHTSVQCLINWHPGRVQRSHRIQDTTTYRCGPVMRPNIQALAHEATPTGSNKTCMH